MPLLTTTSLTTIQLHGFNQNTHVATTSLTTTHLHGFNHNTHVATPSLATTQSTCGCYFEYTTTTTNKTSITKLTMTSEATELETKLPSPVLSLISLLALSLTFVEKQNPQQVTFKKQHLFWAKPIRFFWAIRFSFKKWSDGQERDSKTYTTTFTFAPFSFIPIEKISGLVFKGLLCPPKRQLSQQCVSYHNVPFSVNKRHKVSLSVNVSYIYKLLMSHFINNSNLIDNFFHSLIS